MKDFWDSQALKYRDNVKAVNFDPLAEELEYHSLAQVITGDDEGTICDVGCGNGKTVLDLAERNKQLRFHGIDFSAEMIAVAEKQRRHRNIPNVAFSVMDATADSTKDLIDGGFDTIIAKRLLINLKGHDKYKAIANIHHLLKEGGRYVMVECFQEPLARINAIRKLLDIDEIRIKPFNEYLDFALLDEIDDRFTVERKVDFGSLYYFASRIFNAAMAKGQPDYYAPVNRIATEITKRGIPVMEGYSPEVMFILRKRQG